MGQNNRERHSYSSCKQRSALAEASQRKVFEAHHSMHDIILPGLNQILAVQALLINVKTKALFVCGSLIQRNAKIMYLWGHFSYNSRLD